MKQYHIHKIEADGRGRCIIPEVKAHTITAAWLGMKAWLSVGTYYIISEDGSKGELHTMRTDRSESAKGAEPLTVCAHCLQAIESREGRQITREIYPDDDEPRACDWCEECDSVLYEIL